jgi:3'-5' exoribonuclease
MAATRTVVVRLSDLVDGQEAVCFAALVKKTRAMTKADKPFIRCLFRDKRVQLEAILWHDHRYFEDSDSWAEGTPFRLEVRGKHDLRYGMQIELLGVRPAVAEDAAAGFDFADLYESSEQDPEHMLRVILDVVEKDIEEPCLRVLVKSMLAEHGELFRKMPAAQNMHHSFTSGLLEHVWSMTRVASFLANHYGRYYSRLDPPFNKGVVVAAVILHDIGKIRELHYHPVEAKYTKQGHLIGHVQIGRDMVRERAGTIEGFPEETLLLLEHAILSHHGKREFGAPVLPQTIEALLVSYIDDLDAKMNIVARQRIQSNTDDDFTERVFGLDNRRIYKGIPEENGLGNAPASLG